MSFYGSISAIKQKGVLFMFEESLIESRKVQTNVKLNKISTSIYLGFKRLFDIIISLFALILLIPVIIVVKIVSLLSKDYDSIFYTQNRIGKNGKLFKLYKFRSMIPNADAVLMELLESDPKIREEYTEMKKLENDPRITKIGKLLRRTSIDELPQIINILKGDMSLIGNRPYLPREKEDMLFYYNDIVKTKPGLTGYWQVSLRSRGTFEERLEMEKFYSNNYNAKMDIKIFFKTFTALFDHKSAK